MFISIVAFWNNIRFLSWTATHIHTYLCQELKLLNFPPKGDHLQQCKCTYMVTPVTGLQ